MDCKVAMLLATAGYGSLVFVYFLCTLHSGELSVADILAGDVANGETHSVHSLKVNISSEGLVKEFNDEADPNGGEETVILKEFDSIGNGPIERDSSVVELPKQVKGQQKGFNSSELDQFIKDDDASEMQRFRSLVNDSQETNMVLDAPSSISKNFTRDIKSFFLRKRPTPTSLSQMNTLLLQKVVQSPSKKRRISSPRDRELISAKLKIQNGMEMKNSRQLSAEIFRNISTFIRSYELMEKTLKIYVYKEGSKPIFHQPITRGLYSSEGWFAKLLEGNKKFTVKDPKKAHLFFLPFSSLRLRVAMEEQKLDVDLFLKSYVKLLSSKYKFWTRTSGADHFLIGCHDRAYKFTIQPPVSNCIRVLCNANVAKGFRIGKDSSLPVTYIRSSSNPQRDVGGKPAKQRSLLAFFAGSLHGYLRPMLLQYWENREPDMKIFGPMRRDPEGKSVYRDFMKNSKYCICARGYEVHTPRIVESIWYGCVPVIIADNYVPPFFEVLDWESFAVFVREDEIPNLRKILLAIPEERYLDMQRRVMLTQQHFLWQKPAVRYDLFHMILHSIWHNRLLQI